MLFKKLGPTDRNKCKNFGILMEAYVNWSKL